MPLFRSFASATIALACALLPGVAGADPSPTSADHRAVTACLQKATENEQHATRCIGVAAQACLKDPDMGSTLGMVGCHLRETGVWDKFLNAHFKTLRDRLPEKRAAKVHEIQRTWIKWRDDKCEMPYILFDGGTMAQPMAAACKMEATALRAIELRRAVATLSER